MMRTLFLLSLSARAAAAGAPVIVQFKDGSTEEQHAAVKKDVVAAGGEIHHEYKLIKGFAGEIPEAHLADHLVALRGHECVENVELDGEVHASG